MLQKIQRWVMPRRASLARSMRGRIRKTLDGAQGMVLRYPFIHVHKGQHRYLRLSPSAHEGTTPEVFPLFYSCSYLHTCVSTWVFPQPAKTLKSPRKQQRDANGVPLRTVGCNL